MKYKNWISCYVFHNKNFERVLTGFLYPLLANLREEKLISSYFFIRYWEGGPHIRLRVQSSSRLPEECIQDSIEAAVHYYFKNQPGAKYSLQFLPYIKETERYGGARTMRLAEKQFRRSSDMVLDLMDTRQKEWDYIDALSLALRLHLTAVKELIKGDTTEAISFFQFVYKNWLSHSVKKVEGQITKSEVKKVKGFFAQSYADQQEKIDQLCAYFWEDTLKDANSKKWSNTHAHLAKELDRAYEKDLMEIPSWIQFPEDTDVSLKNRMLYPFYDSLVHMTNNRLGIYLRDEAFIAYLLSKGLQSVVVSCSEEVVHLGA